MDLSVGIYYGLAVDIFYRLSVGMLYGLAVDVGYN